MTRRTLALLILTNLVLLAGVLAATFTPRQAQAQLGRQSPQYTMIAGDAVGLNQQQAVYLMELTTGLVLPISYNTANDRLTVFRGREIGRDAGGAVRNR